jgi:hypothetical protein
VRFKFSPVGGDINRSGPPWALSPLPTSSTAMRKFEMHPISTKSIYRNISGSIKTVLGYAEMEKYFV